MNLPEFRSIGTYYFEGGGILRITVSGDVGTSCAIEMAEEILALKREELAKHDLTNPPGKKP